MTNASTLRASVDKAALAGAPPPPAKASAAAASAASTSAAGPASAGSGVLPFALRHSAANESTSAAAASQRLWPASTSALPTGGSSSSSGAPDAEAGAPGSSTSRQRSSSAALICRQGPCITVIFIGIIPLRHSVIPAAAPRYSRLRVHPGSRRRQHCRCEPYIHSAGHF
ncbi:hypothetical protein [Paenibacillus sp. FSL R7-0337]|uniref:hypothetical protein n=1 Tax=Paenibacillus sp. FSL R7-0337 TaxID=1926588 RepID=UPI0030DC9311